MLLKNFFEEGCMSFKLVYLWKESCSLFSSNALKGIFFCTWKNFVRSMKMYFKYLWWSFLCMFFAIVMQYNSLLLASLFIHGFFCVLVTRPSVEAKTTKYLLKYSKYLINILVGMTIISIFFYFLSCIPKVIFSALLLLFAFIFVDLDCSIKDIFRSMLISFKVMCFFAPLFLVFVAVQYFFCNATKSIAESAAIYFNDIFQSYSVWMISLMYMIACFFVTLCSIMISIFMFSFLSILYSKIKYSHHSLCFPSR
jgi:hypothetical protein